MSDISQIIVQLPIVGIFIWYTMVMIGKWEKFVIKMQDDQQAFITDRDKQYENVLCRLGKQIEDNSRETKELSGAVKKGIDAQKDLVDALDHVSNRQGD